MTTRKKALTNNRFTNDAFPFYLPIISKRQLVRKLSTFLDYTARQVKMLIDSRSRLERIRKLQRRLRSLFRRGNEQRDRKGDSREVAIRVTRTRAGSPSYRVKTECPRRLRDKVRRP